MKILQIMPALPGWSSVFYEEGGTFRLVPLAGWALVQMPHGDQQRVIGLIAIPGHQSLECVELRGLLGYTYPGCDTDWAEEARAEQDFRAEQ